MIKQFHLEDSQLLTSFESDHVYFQIEDQSVEVGLDEMREFYKELGDFLYPEKTVKIEFGTNGDNSDFIRSLIKEMEVGPT